MTVFLVGAGPGDPGLLTVRAAEVISRADVVVYDRLSVGGVLESVPETAERVYVGKKPGDPRTRQGEINDLLVDLGRRHGTVVRLKGGDPFVFARGGEEAAALAAAGVPFEVVPGITSAIAVPAYAGIPVTLRHSSTSFTVVTGHEDPDTPDSVDWSAVARVGGTICILMGVMRWERIAAALMAGGLDPDTPAAAVHWGTRPNQRTTRATLATLGDHALESPSVVVVGRVAATDVAWFETKPLFGMRVVVTRTRDQASALSARLAELGADALEIPTITVTEPADGGDALAGAVEELRAGAYEWVVLTSPNGADRLLRVLRDARDLVGVKVACIGPGTAARLAQGNVVADLVPERFIAEGLLEALTAHEPGRALIVRAAVARDTLPDGLVAAGWEVDVAAAYRTVPADIDDAARAAIAAADVITFTSSSTVENFVAATGGASTPPIVACIGPITAATATGAGIDVTVTAPVHTIDGLVTALVEAVGRTGVDARRP